MAYKVVRTKDSLWMAMHLVFSKFLFYSCNYAAGISIFQLLKQKRKNRSERSSHLWFYEISQPSFSLCFICGFK